MPSVDSLLQLGRKLIPSRFLPSTGERFPATDRRLTALIWIVAVAIGGSIAIGLHDREIREILRQTIGGLVNPRQWLSVPPIENRWLLLVPTLFLVSIVQFIRAISPIPRAWSRGLVASILLALTFRYVFWRTLATLNFSTLPDGFFSALLWLLEMFSVSVGTIQLALIFTLKERRSEADRYSQAVIAKQYFPTVDILIPTYNEPAFILRRTVIGCQAIEYPNKKIYVLDDTDRDEIRQLARELGCDYLARSEHDHAKAGNLNHALSRTEGEFVAVFDADFIPCTNFLERTIGFFQDPEIALVQTPQSFYNADPIIYNLGLENIVTAEEEVFYRYLQPIKDGAGSVVCAGTSFVVRRGALERVGYFNTESISEDYFTGIELTAKGYRAIYLKEKLSAGLAAEGLSLYLQQRLRWARGTLQAFFIEANPLTIPGLTFRQRLAHFEGIISWLSPISRLLFLLVPLLYTFGNIVPLRVTLDEFVYFIMPFFFTQIISYHWINERSRSYIFSEFLSVILCLPLAVEVVKIILDPFGKGFTVTLKGVARNRFVYSWELATPLILLALVTASGILVNLYRSRPLQNPIELVGIWGSYNLFFLLISLVALRDAPRSIERELLAIDSPVELSLDPGRGIKGTLEKLSETNAEIRVDEPPIIGEKILVEIIGEGLQLSGKIVGIEREKKSWKTLVEFDPLDLPTRRKVVSFLFCRPERWTARQTPGEWYSLWLLLGSLFRGIVSIGTRR